LDTADACATRNRRQAILGDYSQNQENSAITHEWDSEGEAMGSVQVAPRQADSSQMPAMTSALRAPAWYAVQTRPRHEKKVASELGERLVDFYLPLLDQVHRWSDRRKLIQVPLFPGYVFVRGHLDSRMQLTIQRIWGILSFVGPQREPQSIPDSQIEDIRKLMSIKVALSPFPFLEVGHRVRVRGGALDGLEGILVANGQKRIVISVKNIQRSLSVTIEGYDVESA
jgi:transcription antitermination factor NusG